MDAVSVISKEALRSAHTSAAELQGEVLSGPERRRRWSIEEKLRVLAQSVAPGSSPSLTCRMHGISTGQLSTWRKQFRSGELTGFVPVSVIDGGALPEPALVPEVPEGAPMAVGVIEVELPTGVRLRITGDVSEGALRRVLAALS
ncbi:IS66-like element accessory protein TnpA [Nitrospirillum sp. BR 11828]|uniref:IS66-like element accessory protein TnpA n=1 Tax=Nitrospirillum sp. BR 11828 TaxID=3104325 RepID=UPI002ACABE2E|nr:transposase [Nitrospirillum sp. BR 11828]MDZ5645636.1 transposase [Nitrospirillum sp. BR 11828]MDZ5646081.1 transposase [Nitrospirillum sp. BR 11828]MDZ5646972.1 transposase [Nitrospirillum sp. BR 11828]MDZ5649436.1 transposase [Nitrospirillum sp. BR 11828]MDZ5650019.1 transposase [Nitrospirillum sp. BR 11828]